uniref:Uncharacterized protein n=1 Tax=Timema tahoe TaxID=61484 RepID=A0A7R9NUQ6_9NEOP|nr:unnamed protein product [Timema tahoe]
MTERSGSLVTTALATLKQLKWHKGVNMKCLDAAGAVGVSGLLWKKHVTDIDVCVCDIRKNAYDLILHNSKLNKLSVEVENKDACEVLYKPVGFNFMAAAIYNKGIHPLCYAMNKSSLTVLVAVKKGARHADQSLGFLRKVLHCTVCQERALCPDTQFCVESPSLLLSCRCASSSVGKVLKELGPVWSGELSHKGFLLAMSQQAIKFPWSQAIRKVMVELLDEIECSNIRNKRKNSNQSNGALAKIQKVDHEPEQSGNTDNSATEGGKCTVELKYDESPPPAFYYNIHHHSPKSHPMRPLNTVVQLLRQAGFRACRTPLDSLSVRTSATLKQLQEVLLKSYS